MNNEEYYIGQIFKEKYPVEASIWCLGNKAFIEKISDNTFEIKSIFDKPTEEKMKYIRGIRNSFLKRFVDQKQLLLVWEDLSDKEKQEIKDYRQYLLDYTKTEKWYEKEPLTFEEWKESQ